ISKQQKIKPTDTLLKYSLSFAGQSQMMYDGTKQKTYINQPLAESGDVAYYNGKYFNSRMRYWYAFEELPEVSYYNEKYFNTWMRYLFAFDELPEAQFQPALGFSSLPKIETDDLTPEYVKVYTRIISTAGMLYQTCGKFTQADEFLTQAMQIRKTAFGKNSPEYLNSLHNIAVLRKDMGWYDEADSLFNYLQPIFKELYTPKSSQYVMILNNKAMLLAELGRTKEAMSLLNEALETGSTVLSNAYFDFERILTNRALLKQDLGDLENAEKDYLQVLENMEKKGFEDHPDYNNVMLYYGSLRVQKNDADLPNFLSRTTDKIRKRYNEDHPLTAKAYSNTADHYLNRKSFAEARDIYRRVIKIQLKVLGEKHKDYLNTLMKLGVCEWHLHDNGNATLHFRNAINGYLLIVNKLFRSMSEPEKSSFWKTLKPAIDTYLTYVLDVGQSDPSLLKDAYELQLKTKGLLINSAKQTRNIILNTGDSVLKKSYNEWLYLKTKLSTYYSSPLEDLKEDKIDLPKIENRANDIEKELSRRSSRFAMEYSPVTISSEDVRAKLNKDQIALEIIRVFHYYGNKKGESEYIALVVKKDLSHPTLVRLGNGIDIEQHYLSNYKKAIKNKTADTKSYPIFWQPLESVIGNCKTIYVSVDGVYNSINLNTLQRNDGTFMLDNYNIILVNNTRSIGSGLKSTVTLAGQETEALLLGSPNYGNDEVIPPLPETKEEIQQIDTLLLRDHIKSKTLIEENATEQNIKSTNHPAILHVATHGFFNENVDLSKKMDMGVRVSFAKDNVLLRSGLFFNGAASIFNKDPVLDASNNGILYAYEAMNLNLQGTNLVVLSACETGIGEIMNGEGVFGLSRSFQVAGADKILMSLWKVDDRVTKEL
ncbi:MAG TPA: CHAT domain-containing tetratricopeptide repeat protein, partial [Chitinophagaceae bacterium]|nr:CHAT domain-containing tetratricopeptide repeat protein [Chitinophagaceae bacterium]